MAMEEDLHRQEKIQELLKYSEKFINCVLLHIFQSHTAGQLQSLGGLFWPPGIMFDTPGVDQRSAMIETWPITLFDSVCLCLP